MDSCRYKARIPTYKPDRDLMYGHMWQEFGEVYADFLTPEWETTVYYFYEELLQYSVDAQNQPPKDLFFN